MNTALLISTIFRRIVRYKLRSFVMTLGILLGTFTLTTVSAAGSGFKDKALDYFNKIFLPDSINLAANGNVPGARPLLPRDIDAIMNEVEGIVMWTPLIPAGRRNLSVDGRENVVSVNGVAEAAQAVLGQPTVSGEYFSREDVSGRARLALVGQTVVDRLFPGESPLGRTLVIDNRVFTVKGVLKELGGDPHGGDLDNIVVIPYTTLQQMNKLDNLVNVRFMATSGADTAAMGMRMATVLRQRHNLGPGEPDDFFISTQPRGKAMFDQFSETVDMLLPVVTAVIYGVSALVIAIIMLSSVRERVPEIGLRKAVGAREWDIGRQFLLETVFLSGVGGVLGILLSWGALFYIENLYRTLGDEIAVMPSPALLLLSMACSILVGLVAGQLPARRAARLRPVEALR